MPKQKTRKHTIALRLALCAKKGGSRNDTLTTFKSVCSPEEAHAKLVGMNSIKNTDDMDDFVHVVRSMIGTKHVIVKIQEQGRMLRMELDIQKRLSKHPNVVRYVCDFECKFNPILWTKPLAKPRTFCDAEGTPMHMIIMEYINNSLDTYLESPYVTDKTITSIVKQVGFALLDIHVNHGICHNDLNRGNILLQLGEHEEHILYSFGDYHRSVPTLGHLVVFIDFQRSSLVEDSDEREYRIIQAADEISLAYELMKKWTISPVYKSALQALMMNIMGSTTLGGIIGLIDSFILSS